MEVDSLEDALDEFDASYLECYHQVTAKLAALALGCNPHLKLSSPLLGPKDDEAPMSRGLLPKPQLVQLPQSAISFYEDDYLGPATARTSTSSTFTNMSHASTNTSTDSAYAGHLFSTKHSDHSELYLGDSSRETHSRITYPTYPQDTYSTGTYSKDNFQDNFQDTFQDTFQETSTETYSAGTYCNSSTDYRSGSASGPLPTTFANAASFGNLGNLFAAGVSPFTKNTASFEAPGDPKCERGDTQYALAEMAAGAMQRTLSLVLANMRIATSDGTMPLRLRLLLTLLITPKLAGRRGERRNTVATYVGNPFYRGRMSPQRKRSVGAANMPGLGATYSRAAMGATARCTFELGEAALAPRGRRDID